MLMQSTLSDENYDENDSQIRILDKKMDIARNEIAEALLQLGKMLSVDINSFDVNNLSLKEEAYSNQKLL